MYDTNAGSPKMRRPSQLTKSMREEVKKMEEELEEEEVSEHG
jgi:hypothetical protein